MKKNWKNNRGYRWVGVIIFLFMLGMPERALTQEVGIRIFEGLLEKTIESGQTSEEADLFGLSYQMVWLL